MPLPPGVSIADRPHFRVQTRSQRTTSLFISRPVIGRVSGEQTIQFSRKLLDPDGAFDGVIVLSLGSVRIGAVLQLAGSRQGLRVDLIGRWDHLGARSADHRP